LNNTATPSSKDASAEDPNEVIGFKAREMTFNLSKIKSDISMERVTFILIDQVRANMKIESRFQAATNEKGVGDFGNYKSATAVSALQHNLRQWVWISKGTKLKPADPLGVDGWIMHVYTEKNKLAPSQFYIPLVFDKKWGVVPFYSEYHFLKEKTKTELRYWPNPKKLVYPFSIVTSANSKKLVVVDPITDNILYDSGKVMERKIMDRYRTDAEFHHWFDRAVEISIEQRIKAALFRDVANKIEISQTNQNSDEDEIEENVASMFDNVEIPDDTDSTNDNGYTEQVSQDSEETYGESTQLSTEDNIISTEASVEVAQNYPEENEENDINGDGDSYDDDTPNPFLADEQ